MNLGPLKLALILFGLSLLMKFQAWRHPALRARLKEKDLTAQFIARDEEIGRWFKFENGRVSSGFGLRKDADVTVGFKNAALGAGLLMPPINWLKSSVQSVGWATLPCTPTVPAKSPYSSKTTDVSRSGPGVSGSVGG